MALALAVPLAGLVAVAPAADDGMLAAPCSCPRMPPTTNSELSATTVMELHKLIASNSQIKIKTIMLRHTNPTHPQSCHCNVTSTKILILVASNIHPRAHHRHPSVLKRSAAVLT